MKIHKLYLTLLVLLLSLLTCRSQQLTIRSDSHCEVLIDGKTSYSLEKDAQITVPISSGTHTLVAKSIEEGLHIRESVFLEDSAVVEIDFLHQKDFMAQKRLENQKRAQIIQNAVAKQSTIIKDISNNMVLIKGGTFELGNPKGAADEQPVKKVMLDDFYIGKYELTQKEWMAVMGENPSVFTGCDDCPVENINWYAAIEFCNRLSELTGLSPYYSINKTEKDTNNLFFYDDMKWIVDINENADGYRLPYEAEWEMAAKEPTDVSAADVQSLEVAWTMENAAGTTHPVGKKQPNSQGLYDMKGNVWELCFDWYDPNAYEKGHQSKPYVPKSGARKVMRGGSWRAHSMHATSTNREVGGADGRSYFTGIRLAKNK